MNEGTRQRWLPVATVVGLIYLIVSFGTATLAGAANSNRIQFAWRLSAFIISGFVLVAHILYERVRLRNSPSRTAWHTSAAAAIGGLGLAVAANIHDLLSTAGYRPRMLVALIAWPFLTAAPAFVVGLLMSVVLSLKWRTS